MNEVEKEIRFHLEKMSGPMVKGDKYRAVIDTDKGEPLDAIEEICKSGKFTSAELQYVVGLTFEKMIRGVLADGRTRRFGDLFEIYPVIRGGFDRVDEQFDPLRHKLVAKFFPLPEFKGHKREKPLVNTRNRPRGRIDYVTYPGGEKGEVKFGEDVIIYGHDLTLTFNDTVEIHLPNGETYGHTFSLDEGNVPRKWDNTDEIIPNTGFVEWDDNHIRFNWFPAIKKEDVVGKKVTVRFRPWSRDYDHTMKLKDADHMGSATKVIVLAP